MNTKRRNPCFRKPLRWLGSHVFELLTIILFAASLYYYLGVTKVMRERPSSETTSQAEDVTP